MTPCWKMVPARLSLPSVTSRHLANYNDTDVLFGTHWGSHIVRPSRPHKFLLLLLRWQLTSAVWTMYTLNSLTNEQPTYITSSIDCPTGHVRLACTAQISVHLAGKLFERAASSVISQWQSLGVGLRLWWLRTMSVCDLCISTTSRAACVYVADLVRSTFQSTRSISRRLSTLHNTTVHHLPTPTTADTQAKHPQPSHAKHCRIHKTSSGNAFLHLAVIGVISILIIYLSKRY